MNEAYDGHGTLFSEKPSSYVNIEGISRKDWLIKTSDQLKRNANVGNLKRKCNAAT